MMASKASLLDDAFTLSAVMATDDPQDQHNLGRRVHHFDHELLAFGTVQ